MSIGTGSASISDYASAVADHLRIGLERRLERIDPTDPESDLPTPEELADQLLEAAPRLSPWAGTVGPVYRGRQLEARLGISRQALAERRNRRTILAPRTADGEFVYPLFQFDGSGQVLSGLAAILKALNPDVVDDWTLVAWLVEPRGELEGESVIDRLRARQSGEQLSALVRNAHHRFSQ